MAIRHMIFAACMASACAAHADVIPAGSANVLGTAGQVALFSSNGLEGVHLLGSGHGILAAMFGSGFSTSGSTSAGAGLTGGAGGIAVTGVGMGGASGGIPGDLTAAAMATSGASTGSHGAIGAQVLAPRAAAAIPEPSTTALMLIGLIGAGALTRRRAR